MAEHEMQAAELHVQLHADKDMSGAPITEPPPYHDEKKVDVLGSTNSDSIPTSGRGEDGDEPNDEERIVLRRIGDSIPASTWLVAVIELCERATFYGAQGLFQNYIERPFDGSQGRGALGMGQQGATGLNTFFSFWCYVTPILGAILADQYFGKYKTILGAAGVYIVGLLILLLTSIPTALAHGAGTGGFITAIIVIGLGTGGIKANVAPLIADQYQRRKMAIKTLASGERVIIDPVITIQRIYMVFYLCINVGSLSLLATPYMEKYVGFWSAYLMCLLLFLVGTAILIFGRSRYVVRPPQGSIITNAFRAMGQMISARNMDAPKPSYKLAHGRAVTNTWDDQFIDEVKRALIACKIFCFYPVFWVAYGQFSNNFVSQAGEMASHGIPNDLMQNFDPISIIVAIPLLDRVIYPLLRKRGIKLRPVTRITIGFFIAALAMAYAAIIQHVIYSTGPCYELVLDSSCTDAAIVDGIQQGNNIHIAVQTPAYILIGLSEVFISVTGLEYAYTKAPPSMKSFVQSMYLLTNAFGSALSEALNPVSKDPQVQWLYVGVCVACAITGTVFWIIFHHLNAQEEAMNELTKNEPMLKRGSISGGYVEEEGKGERVL